MARRVELANFRENERTEYDAEVECISWGGCNIYSIGRQVGRNAILSTEGRDERYRGWLVGQSSLASRLPALPSPPRPFLRHISSEGARE